MKSLIATPPGLELVVPVRDDYLTFAILADLAGRDPDDWVRLIHIYASSPGISHQNELAARGLRSFVTPNDLLMAARAEKCLAVQERDGEWEVRRRCPAGKRTSKSISAVLRYDSAGWLKLSALQTLIQSRFGSLPSFGELLITILADPIRFELDMWEGDWWARANYRYPSH
jgi:hypothetical protein